MPDKQIGEGNMYIISAVVKNNHSRIALYDQDQTLLQEKEGAFTSLSQLCLDVISEQNVKPTDIDYIGIAVDQAVGTPALVASEVEKNTGIRSLGTSVMGARALGEAHLAGDVPSLFLLKVDDTVECGIVIENKVFSGMHQLGGKIAHMVIDFDGFECACGRKGCFEAYASNAGLKRIAAHAGLSNVESLTHAKLFEMSSPEAELAKKEYIAYLAGGITNIINLFQPNDLVLEGPFTKVGQALTEPMMEIILREQYTHSLSNKCNIKLADQVQDTALIGASLLGR